MNQQERLFIIEEPYSYENLHLDDFEAIHYLIRPTFIDSPFTTNCVIDFFYFYYMDKIPELHEGYTKIYLARKTYLDWLIKEPMLDLCRAITKGNKSLSLLAAVLSVNVVCDAYEVIAKDFNQDQIRFLERFMGYKEQLLKTELEAQYSELELSVTEKVVEYINTNCSNCVSEVKQFINEFSIIQQESFQTVKTPFRMMKW